MSSIANGSSQTFTVAAIAENSYLSGMRRDNETGEEIAGMAMTLGALQELTGTDGQISAIALSNQGGVKNGIDRNASVQSELRPAVDSAGLAINSLKQDWLDDANMIASVFTGLFLVVGLFSISAGILLILLIFTMLAAERRSEMGMARAVGAQRSSLVQQFMSEGALYALLAGLVGSALGVGVAYADLAGVRVGLRQLRAHRNLDLGHQRHRGLLPGRGHHLPGGRRSPPGGSAGSTSWPRCAICPMPATGAARGRPSSGRG